MFLQCNFPKKYIHIDIDNNGDGEGDIDKYMNIDEYISYLLLCDE